MKKPRPLHLRPLLETLEDRAAPVALSLAATLDDGDTSYIPTRLIRIRGGKRSE
jgi:hypothetical protein